MDLKYPRQNMRKETGYKQHGVAITYEDAREIEFKTRIETEPINKSIC